MEVVRRELMTPIGLRTLSPRHPHYTGKYAGALVARDRAYHQGTVFPWLLGPYVTAMLRVRGRGEAVRAEARQVLQGCLQQLNRQGLGQLCELFDGDAPHLPGGLPASARSVAEVLRCYVEDVLDLPAAADPVSAQSVTFGSAVGRQDALRS
jgi:glycogen debranching enzyme